MSNWQILLLGILSILIIDFLIHLYYGWKSVPLFESCPPFRQDMSGIDVSAVTRIQIPSTNGVTLRGAIFAPRQEPCGVILFLPEVQGCWQTAAIHASGLTDAGLAVVAVDFRNQGESDALVGYSPTHWASEYELQDAQEALSFIRRDSRLGHLPLGVHGVSRGACVALALAAREPQIGAVLAQGPFSRDALSLHFGRELLRSLCGPLARFVPDWHIRLTLQVTCFLSERRHGCRYLEISNSLHRLSGRSLMLTVGARDQYVPPRLVKQLAIQAAHIPEDVVWIVPSSKHNQERRVMGAEFDRRICEFFVQSLSRSSPAPFGPQQTTRIHRR